VASRCNGSFVELEHTIASADKKIAAVMVVVVLDVIRNSREQWLGERENGSTLAHPTQSRTRIDDA
jgi:hypothetical protein